MEEEYKRKLTWFANQVVKKDVVLPSLRPPKPDDKFSVLIDSIDHLLTESFRQETLVLPELSAFNNKSIGVFTDYSGEGSGRYNVYSILICGMNMASGFHDRVAKVRTDFHLGDKEIAYKDLNMGQIRRSMPGFLEAADHLPGLLYTVAVEKGIKSVFGREPDTTRKIAGILESIGLGTRPPKTAEKMMRVAHLVAYFIALLGHGGQNVFWMTDHDEIGPSLEQHQLLMELCFGRVLPFYLKPETKFGVMGGAIPFTERSVEMNDRLSLPDLVAGVLGDYLTKRDILKPEDILVKDAVGDILLWLTRDGIALKKICTFLRPGANGEIERGTVTFAPTNPQDAVFIPLFI
ncbi:hypothetical protein [Terriglobus sp. RCC_193]|uniref:hypothetical protein n=1 Tax=Terriglobus sp. RCC_193 TaxID=3239218 RepID=UPI003524FF1B